MAIPMIGLFQIPISANLPNQDRLVIAMEIWAPSYFSSLNGVPSGKFTGANWSAASIPKNKSGLIVGRLPAPSPDPPFNQIQVTNEYALSLGEINFSVFDCGGGGLMAFYTRTADGTLSDLLGQVEIDFNSVTTMGVIYSGGLLQVWGGNANGQHPAWNPFTFIPPQPNDTPCPFSEDIADACEI